jgi:hypothetical protein
MLGRIARADADAAASRGINRLKGRRECFDCGDQLGVGERWTRTRDRDRVRIAIVAEVQVINRPQGLAPMTGAG